ncbi:glycerol-3-phosphate 1-O-acyltransferase PlsB [Candidatus Profftia sp. (ex Adelges kitamiensis)]|uniref:glycerol-3-phosphate 1-O-acyltransferase PlsB n=1 Tax=Candidatus Profftia sp. (ex Adelges kitamiensis) TaxID=2864218 RepID=UPI001CE2E7B4|nr:glycerol-3-phosphate 1-O-acyltransferase PlsB [Candidatus Profftia sp. (ex Adelges kitamiensis)]
MLFCRKFYFKLLYLNIKIFIKSKTILSEPLTALRLDITYPILYILPYYSQIDFLTFRYSCLSNNLPDPLDDNKIDDTTVLPRTIFIEESTCLYSYTLLKQGSVKLLHQYLELYCHNQLFNIQIIPILVMLSRSPYCNISYKKLSLYQKFMNIFKKIFTFIFLGSNGFVLFSKKISLHDIVNQYGAHPNIVKKMIRMARMYFSRQILSAIGPIPSHPKDVFIKILSSKEMSKAIEDESRGKKISLEQAKKKAVHFIKEIASNFTYIVMYLSDRVLSLMWNFLYQSIDVHNIERVRKLAQEGDGIVYIPCHRSHMDYLLLSYILYHQGLVPPYIAAGINLNFWPAGPIFRRLGAFFIRRSFKGNKLYSIIFREYLSELFNRGHAIGYFMEGGRSRTGRLLNPKTGILSITIQLILRGLKRPITLIPVYIGYEHIIEVETYSKELRGEPKEKENLVQMVRGLIKLRNLGRVYINFGEPITINNWLNQHVPEWKNFINLIEVQRPCWLTPIVNKIANTVMININKSAAVNAINLCSLALLAAPKHILTRTQLLEQLECYLQLLRNVPYTLDATVPYQTSEELLNNALYIGKFKVEKDNLIERIILTRKQAILLIYYNNNIQHMLVLPSLIANIVIYHNKMISRNQLLQLVKLLYPILKEEWFLYYKFSTLFKVLESIITELCRQQLIYTKNDNLIINPERIFRLHLLAFVIRENIQLYAIVFFILSTNPDISRSALEKESCLIVRHLSVLNYINTPEFFDKTIFSKLVTTLRSERYVYDVGDTFSEHIMKIYNLLLTMITPEIKKYFSDNSKKNIF